MYKDKQDRGGTGTVYRSSGSALINVTVCYLRSKSKTKNKLTYAKLETVRNSGLHFESTERQHYFSVKPKHGYHLQTCNFINLSSILFDRS
jgi:hypothetical protein